MYCCKPKALLQWYVGSLLNHHQNPLEVWLLRVWVTEGNSLRMNSIDFFGFLRLHCFTTWLKGNLSKTQSASFSFQCWRPVLLVRQIREKQQHSLWSRHLNQLLTNYLHSVWIYVLLCIVLWKNFHASGAGKHILNRCLLNLKEWGFGCGLG